jgi:hypothetical protein
MIVARLSVVMVLLISTAVAGVGQRLTTPGGAREGVDVTWLVRRDYDRVHADAMRKPAELAEVFADLPGTGEETPGWQRAGARVLELVGGGAASCGTACLTAVEVVISQPRDVGAGTVALSTCLYAVNSALITGSLVFGLDQVFGQNGMWGAAAGGAVLGAAIGGPLFFLLGPTGKVPWEAWLPPLSARRRLALSSPSTCGSPARTDWVTPPASSPKRRRQAVHSG